MAENAKDKAVATKASIDSKMIISSLNQCAGTGPEIKRWTALQQHVSDFDVNKDGIIYPWETYAGLRSIGWSIIASSVLTIVFHLTFSYSSLSGWIPSFLFPVYIENIHRSKHGIEMENYYRFIPEISEKLLSSLYPSKPANKLKVSELLVMTADIIQWMTEKARWTAMCFLVEEEYSSLLKEVIFLHGTLYEYIARKHAEKN